MAYWLIFWLVGTTYITARLVAKRLPKLARLLKITGSWWFVFMTYGLLLLPIADLVALAFRLAGAAPAPTTLDVGIGLLVVFAVIIAYGSFNAWRPIVRRYDITIRKAAGSRRRLRIAVASDLHLGAMVGHGHIARLVQQIRALEPDLILLPGDVLDDDIGPFIRLGMPERLRQLQAPLGTYAILGNHEYIGGAIDEYAAAMREIGIEVLMDRTIRLPDGITLIGRKDRAATRMGGAKGRMPLKALLEGVDPASPLILMDHQPAKLEEAVESGIDLQLSGHTHRGQMFPFHWITRRLFEVDWGYLKKGATHIVVSSGFGFWGPPLRLASRSEVLDIHIHFAPEDSNSA
ncbi:MAG: metallophosphoesterase [Paenibacillaceae bacterium]|nr:metallophosphoesterase [Paenibacillaceae bacterium]